jgi:hypothetical protein
VITGNNFKRHHEGRLCLHLLLDGQLFCFNSFP